MTEEQKKAMMEFLKENLRLESKTTEYYVGELGGGEALYEKSNVVNLVLCGDVISSISF